MTQKKTYYAQLKPIVLKFVKFYQTDFTTHDKAALKKAKTFLLGIRETGTDITLLDPEHWAGLDAETFEKHKRIAILWLTEYNDRFFYGHDGTVEEVSKDRAIAIVNDLKRDIQDVFDEFKAVHWQVKRGEWGKAKLEALRSDIVGRGRRIVEDELGCVYLQPQL